MSRNNHVQDPDFGVVSDATAKVHDICKVINEKKDMAERMQQVLQVQHSLSGEYKVYIAATLITLQNLVRPNRRLMREGALKIDMRSASGKAGDRIVGFHHLFLFNDIIIIAKPTPSDTKRFAHVRTILIELCDFPQEKEGTDYDLSADYYRNSIHVFH